eukprot:scaffold1967_cov148-Skeletonema_menzelii.AAC.6
MAAIPNHSSSGQLCGCISADTIVVRLSRRRYDVVLAAIPNHASSGQLCGCIATDTIVVRLSRRYLLLYSPPRALYTFRRYDVVLTAIPNHASSGQLCGSITTDTIVVRLSRRRYDVVLAAIPNQSLSGQLCGCIAADTIVVRLSRRHCVRLGGMMWSCRPSQIKPHRALYTFRRYDVVLAAIPNQSLSGQLCGCIAADTIALYTFRRYDVVLTAIPNHASSGHLCGCIATDTIVVRLSRRRCIRLGGMMWCRRPSQITPHQVSYVDVSQRNTIVVRLSRRYLLLYYPPRALYTFRRYDVVLTAIPNHASSGQLCGCITTDTIVVRLSRRYLLLPYPPRV